jgi:hypothetical protein
LDAYKANKRLTDRKKHFNKWYHDSYPRLTKNDKKYLDYYMVDDLLVWWPVYGEWYSNTNFYKLQLNDIQSDLIRDLEYNAHQRSKSIYNKKLFNKRKHQKN